MWPSGALTQVRTVWPGSPCSSPVRRSRTCPTCSLPTQVWQIPIRQPNGSSAPACSPPTRIETPDVAGRLDVGDAEAARCRRSRPRRRRVPMIGWKRSMCRRVGVAVLGSSGPRASRPSARAGRRGTSSRSRQSGQISSRSPASSRRDRAGQVLDAACSRRTCAFIRRRYVAEDHLVGLARAVQVDDVVERVAALELAQHAPDRRDRRCRR